MTFPDLTRAGQVGASRSVAADDRGPVLDARAYLLKCPGGDLVSCNSCARRIAPAAEVAQRWVEPPLSGACDYYANVNEFGWVYGHGAPPDSASSPYREGSDKR